MKMKKILVWAASLLAVALLSVVGVQRLIKWLHRRGERK